MSWDKVESSESKFVTSSTCLFGQFFGKLFDPFWNLWHCWEIEQHWKRCWRKSENQRWPLRLALVRRASGFDQLHFWDPVAPMKIAVKLGHPSFWDKPNFRQVLRMPKWSEISQSNQFKQRPGGFSKLLPFPNCFWVHDCGPHLCRVRLCSACDSHVDHSFSQAAQATKAPWIPLARMESSWIVMGKTSDSI